ncbi:Por secretion system C-terminal sorting domain-containing protein [Mucilaginibacter sp. OK268]|uniref:T9SS type A sorting domain-containing protein n=1 Tax=Mucilaginibacter sp. OK268 TaxID=1881048 RepID=UPI0008841D6E|nr:T9SS type A sorting domain-containing protein [Mucilaginibacter sp. OK268]SDP62117.1 Por secretion system C-terminal sorting domain-containing protein [Mucilaginibacter sp. OK268]
MRRKITYSFIYTYTWFILIAMAVFMNLAFVSDAKIKNDTTYLRASKEKAGKMSYFKNGLHLVLPPTRPAITSSVKVSVSRPNDKLLNDVQLYPNPVTDQINLKYTLSRNTNVTIKIMDVLGNDITTMFSSRVDSGDHNINYPIANKLTRGFYFVRVVAGTESVIKRISVL